MPRQIPENEFEEIIEAIAQFPDGASLHQVMGFVSTRIQITRRRVQHRLRNLVNQGRVIPVGNARARLYYLSKENTPIKQYPVSNIPLLSASDEVEALISRPLIQRDPVGYKREFLDEYRPNITYYLSKSVRQYLYKLGATDGERPAGTYIQQVFERLLIDLSWNSSRLEGNTYSLLETERLLNLTELAEGRDLKEARMLLNHKDAIEFLVDSAPHIGINRHTILNLHALLSNDLLGDLSACGRLRSIPVGIGKTVYHPMAIPQLIDELFQQILNTAQAVEDPFEQAFFLMVHLPYLQPFEDVNKRVSRLAANIPLIQKNLCPLSFIDVPKQVYVNGLLGVYELNRVELLRDVFVWAYKRSCLRYSVTCKEMGDPNPLRMRYRDLICRTVRQIIQQCMGKSMAISTIQNCAQVSVSVEERPRFIELVEQDLMSLHEGNMARYRIQPDEYKQWKKGWC